MASDNLAGMLRNIVLLLAVTIALASVTYYAVEKPVMRWIKSRRNRKLASPPGTKPVPAEPAPSAS
jgi:peptidoglycan/LPS O-acetylase OafA/YrhL